VSCVIAPRQILTAEGEITGADGVAFTVTEADVVQPVVVNDDNAVYVVFNVGFAAYTVLAFVPAT